MCKGKGGCKRDVWGVGGEGGGGWVEEKNEKGAWGVGLVLYLRADQAAHEVTQASHISNLLVWENEHFICHRHPPLVLGVEMH